MFRPLIGRGFLDRGKSASRRALRSSLNPRPEDTAPAALCDAGLCKEKELDSRRRSERRGVWGNDTPPAGEAHRGCPTARDRSRPGLATGSLVDLVNTLQELNALAVGFVSLCEALDLTTPSGRALAGMLAVFAEFERDILRDRVKAGIDQARKDGKPHGRPMTAGKLVPEMKQLRKNGLSKWEIAKRLGVSRTSVIRWLGPRKRS